MATACVHSIMSKNLFRSCSNGLGSWIDHSLDGKWVLC